MNGWQVYIYAGNYGGTHGGDIPGRLVFDEVFPTKQAAEAAWYDTMPGRNDRATYVRVKGAVRHEAWEVRIDDMTDRDGKVW